MRFKRFIQGSSDSASSVPSPPVEQEIGYINPGSSYLSACNEQTPRQLTISELEHATGCFSQSKIIGEGGFGLVYQGLLEDGSIVAIKRRFRFPIHYFLQEVKHIAGVRHKHLVKLLGYCEESSEQFLVYEYLPNGNVGNHLYGTLYLFIYIRTCVCCTCISIYLSSKCSCFLDSEGLPIGKLEMRQRLSIALGAAKGLEHLHSLVPPVLHTRFKTRNVLVDENFVAKVSDFGLSKLLLEANHAGSSSAFDCFLDPELRSFKDVKERSDVYSFGVFLLELISGKDANDRSQSDVQENLVLRAKTSNLENLVDKKAKDHLIDAVKKMMELALLCIDIGERRPSMNNIVQELEKIQEREIGHLHSHLNEDIGMVTLGSELFK
ncbi:hypothetical protein LguiB_000988 [Lonicera macranthoides]